MSDSYKSFADRRDRRDRPRKTWTLPASSGGYRSSADRQRGRQRLYTEDKPERMRRDINNDYVSSDGGTIYSKDGKRYTSNGVTYDRATGQAINTGTGKISEGGYSIDPKTKNRTDYKPGQSRIPDRENSDGVDTSFTGKSTAAGPMDWKDYEDSLNAKGIYLQVDRAGGVGNHPTYEQAVTDAKEYDYGSEAGYGGYETYTDSPDQTKYTPTGQSTALGAQTGTSSDADVGDQSRALRIPKGARQREAFFRQNPNYGQEDKTSEPMTSAISARSRAFLDAPMGQGVLGVMRRTNAAQNILRQGDQIVIKTGEGTYTPITQEGYDEIRQNQRNATEFKEEFMRNHVPESPAETQSPDSGAPVPASKMEYNTNFGPTVDTESYGKILESMKGMTAIGPIADGEVYGMILDGREPLMRGPKKDEE